MLPICPHVAFVGLKRHADRNSSVNDFRRGLEFRGDDPRLLAALERIGEGEGRPRASFLRTYEAKRTGAYLRCARHLARVARRCEKDG